MQGYRTSPDNVIPFPHRGIEPTTAIIYRTPEDSDDAAVMLANMERRGVAYAAPVDVQRQLWARGRSHAKLAHRIATRQAVSA